MSVIKKIGRPFHILAFIGDHLQSLLLLAMRLFWGILLFYTGMGKIHDIEGTANYFATVGIPLPLVSSYIVGFFEYVGGACLCLGLATRMMCIPLLIIMIVALMTAHHEATMNILENPGLALTQPPGTFVIVLVVLFVFGPGRVSLDYFFEKLSHHHTNNL